MTEGLADQGTPTFSQGRGKSIASTLRQGRELVQPRKVDPSTSGETIDLVTCPGRLNYLTTVSPKLRGEWASLALELLSVRNLFLEKTPSSRSI